MDVATAAMKANRPSAARDAQRRYALHLMRATLSLVHGQTGQTANHPACVKRPASPRGSLHGEGSGNALMESALRIIPTSCQCQRRWMKSIRQLAAFAPSIESHHSTALAPAPPKHRASER